MPSGTTVSFTDLWNGLDYEPLFDTNEIKHPNGSYGNQYSTAFLGNASQSTLVVSKTTGTLFQMEQKSGQVYYVKTDGTTGTFFSTNGSTNGVNSIASDDTSGMVAYVTPATTSYVLMYSESGKMQCSVKTAMSFISSIAAKGGYVVFADPTDNKVGIMKSDCSGYGTPISVAGQPWAVAMDGSGYAYVFSRDKCANAVPCVTKIAVATGTVVATLDLPSITPVSTLRAASGYAYAGVYTIVAFSSASTPVVNALFMSDKTDGTVLTINTSTMKVTYNTPITNLPYVLAAQDGTTPILRVGYFLADSGEAVTHIGDLDPSTGNYIPAVGACPTGLVGGLVAGVRCAGGSTISAPLTIP